MRIAMRMDDRAQQLLRTRTPFVHATVVRAAPPTSAHPGDEAILLSDGTIEGFVGGHCAQNSVRKAALGALQTNESVLLRVLPDGDVHFPEAPGACVVVNPCLSGGALEIFLVPQLPAPLVQVFGATPIADDRKVFQRLDSAIKDLFMRKKVMYTRNYGEGVDLTWQDAFQTEDRSQVEEYCRKVHAEFEWKDGNRLRTRQVRQTVAVHPKVGEMVWFNHAHMFHISNMEAAVREYLLSAFKEEDLPRNAYYGDGSRIETSVLDEIRGVYNETSVTFPWQEGDILMLDNFLASHGREPFVGPRKIVVAMAELYTNKDI